MLAGPPASPCVRGVLRQSPTVMGDDDGVVVVRRHELESVAQKSEARENKEAGIREKYREGTLGLDMNNMRKRLLDMGLQYVTYKEDRETTD